MEALPRRRIAGLRLGTMQALLRFMKTSSYVVRIDSNRGVEEYDGGATLAGARKEASFFVASTPAYIGVRIARVTVSGGISLVEVVR